MTGWDLVAVQRRTVAVLVAGQVLGGLGIGAIISVGAVLAAEVAGSESWAGAAATLSTLGAALVALPLSRLAQRAGRRIALTTGTLAAALGAAIVIAAAAASSFPLLLVGFAFIGSGVAVNLQSRFAATDVASDAHRGRDLSIVVWSATVGSVIGPNLFAPGEQIAEWLGMPPLTGPFAIAIAAQVLAAVVYLLALRPDPFLISRELAAAPARPTDDGDVRGASLLVLAIAAVAVSHAVMVSVMSMTPVHLLHNGAALTLIGLTISLHIAGMFGLSPVFGWLSDRIGRIPTILVGQALFAVSLVVLALGYADQTLVTVGLVLLGLGWSASTVAGSALVADLVTGAARTRIQGRTDLVMNLAGAAGGASAGPVLAAIGYPGLASLAGILVAVTIVGVLVVASGRGRMPQPVR